MHYLVIVVSEEKPSMHSIDEALRPYYEREWDWFQVGGRWTGYLDGYDPDTDPKLQEKCKWCEGTGTTTENVGREFPAYKPNVGQKCYQCKGKGSSTAWPTQWPTRGTDLAFAAKDLTREVDSPYAFVYDYSWISKESFDRGGAAIDSILGRESKQSHFVPTVDYEPAWKKLLAKAKQNNWWLTVVDCHN